jgi:hypothetical protein
VRDVWLFAHKSAHVLFHHAIGIGDALMLPPVLKPRIDQKGLEHPTCARSVLIEAPRVGAVALALVGDARESGEECFTFFGGNMIFDGDQHRTGAVFHRGRRRGISSTRHAENDNGTATSSNPSRVCRARHSCRCARCFAKTHRRGRRPAPS